jgi:hypothetical protein
LIQILRINAPGAAALEQVASKVPGVNRLWQASERAKAASVGAEAAFEAGKRVILEGPRFTAR